MVQVNLSDEDLLKEAKDITLFKYRFISILALIMLIFSIFSVSIFKRYYYFYYNLGIGIDVLIFIYVIFLFDSYFRIKKDIIKNFDKNYQMGIKILNINLINNSLVIEDKVLNYSEKIDINDIKKYYKFMSVIIFKLSDKSYKYIPNTKKIQSLINDKITK